MKIVVKVKPGSREESVERISDTELVLKVRAPARDNLANGAVVKLLSEYLDIPKSRIIIVKGHNSRTKVVSIE